MLARDAENLFWTGRYLERAEDTARLLDVTYHGLLEAAESEEDAVWTRALDAVGLLDAYRESGRPLTADAVSAFLVHDPDNPGSITAAVERARENVRAVRESVSSECWETINSFCLQLRARDLVSDVRQRPHDLYGFVRRYCQTVAGVVSETLPRGDAYRFLRMGWNLERAEWTCRLLRVRQVHIEAPGTQELDGILRAASGLEAYRRNSGGSIDPVRVIDFLLLSDSFPRSVYFAVRVAEDALREASGGTNGGRALRLLGRIRAELEFAEPGEILSGDFEGQMLRFESAIRGVSTATSVEFFINLHDVGLHSVTLAGSEALDEPWRDPLVAIEDESRR